MWQLLPQQLMARNPSLPVELYTVPTTPGVLPDKLSHSDPGRKQEAFSFAQTSLVPMASLDRLALSWGSL